MSNIKKFEEYVNENLTPEQKETFGKIANLVEEYSEYLGEYKNKIKELTKELGKPFEHLLGKVVDVTYRIGKDEKTDIAVWGGFDVKHQFYVLDERGRQNGQHFDELEQVEENGGEIISIELCEKYKNNNYFWKEQK